MGTTPAHVTALSEALAIHAAIVAGKAGVSAWESDPNATYEE